MVTNHSLKGIGIWGGKDYPVRGSVNILIVKLSALGDVVQALPAFEALRQHFPAAHITWLLEEPADELLRYYPGLDEILVCPRRRWLKHLRQPYHWPQVAAELVKFCRHLRRRPYEVVIDLQGLAKSAVWVGLARGKRKIGFSGSREGSSRVLNEPLPPYDPDQHAVERYLDVARYLGATVNGMAARDLWAPEDAARVERFLRELPAGGAGLIAAVHPVARWPTKLWPEANFAALARMVAEKEGGTVIFTGSNSDREVVGRIVAMAGTEGIHNWAGRLNLRELAYLLRRVSLLISTDSGPMHLAAAVGTRVVALFGPTAPWRTGPYGNGHQVVRAALDCSPCFQRQCQTNRCMREISADEVWCRVAEMLVAR